MWSFFERLLDSSTLSPHGICLLWEPELIWLHVLSDACHRDLVFLDPVCACDSRLKTAGLPVRLGRVGVCHLHPGVRVDPYFFDLHAVGANLRYRRHRQGDHGGSIDRHGCDALAADTKGSRHSVGGATSRGPCRARGRRKAAPRVRDAATALPGDGSDRDADQTSPEDGSDRATHRRNCPRLQQYSVP